MSMNMGNIIYWHKNQVIIRLNSEAGEHIEMAHKLMNPDNNMSLKDLNVRLEIIRDQNPEPISMRSMTNRNAAANSPEQILFARIVANPPDPANTPMSMESQSPKSDTTGMSSKDYTIDVVKQLNGEPVLQRMVQGGQPSSTEIKVLPHWLWSGTDDTIHGCPVSPPIPVPVEELGAIGQWKTLLQPSNDSSLRGKTGRDVTVFIFDAFPSSGQIKQAADNAGKNNTLLRKMIPTNSDPIEAPSSNAPSPIMRLDYQDVPDEAETAATGKDIYGRLIGFPMEDHGLAIAGIIRDIAPEANIECIRVLNDYGVGDVQTLFLALQSIQKRMSDGDLQNRSVVINLSLVVLPPENDWPDELGPEIKTASLDLLHSMIKCLADDGAFFVASVGNDSDPRDARMNPMEIRFGPRYPAAFAYDEKSPITAMLPVGAVNRHGQGAMYSNYPGENGIATYGGELPRPIPWLPSATSHIKTLADTREPVDALRCLYTAPQYPALSMNDPYPAHSSTGYPLYQAPYTNTWAYWSGTSFAVPIISALAALILQGKNAKDIDVRQAIIDMAQDKTLWTRVEGDGEGMQDVNGPMIMAVQKWQSQS